MYWTGLSAGTPGAALGIVGLGIGMWMSDIEQANYNAIYNTLTQKNMDKWMREWKGPDAGGVGVPNNFHKFHPATYAQEIVDYHFWGMSAKCQRRYLAAKENPRPSVTKKQCKLLKQAEGWYLYKSLRRGPLYWKAQAELDKYNAKLAYWRQQYQLSVVN